MLARVEYVTTDDNPVTRRPVRIAIEASATRGLPVFHAVGMRSADETALRDAVCANVESAGYAFPAMRITVNVAPNHVRSRLDIERLVSPVAVAVLLASGQLPQISPDAVIYESTREDAMSQVRAIPSNGGTA